MKNQIKFKNALPPINDFWHLFITTGWNEKYCFSIYELEESLKNSWYMLSLYEDDKLIGFGRIISDGIYHALIADLIILPEYQGKGLGSELLARLVKRCKKNTIRDIQLFSAINKFAFYEKHGFIRRSPNAPGMELIQAYQRKDLE